MDLHWNLSDKKSSQVSRTLLSILADLIYAVVWIVFICPLISKSSNPFANPLGIVPSAPITIGITVIFMFHSFFSPLARDRYSSFFSVSLSLLYGMPRWQSPLFGRLSFLVDYLLVWSSGQDKVICLYFKHPKKSVHLIIQADYEFCLNHFFVWLN